MKIWDIIKEDFEAQPIEEDWKKNVLATVISVASIFGSAKSQVNQPEKQSVSVNKKVDKDTLKLDIGRLFGSGRYIFSINDNDKLKNLLRELGAEVIKHPTADFMIEIVSSESQVPNYDSEPTSPTYKKRLDVKELAQKRTETVNFVLKNLEQQFKKSGVFKGNFKFTTPKILIGDIPWPSIDPSTGDKRTNDDQVYTKDQYVTANIKIIDKNVTSDPYSVYAKMGQERNVGNKLVGMIFFPTRKTVDITKSGNKDTGYENVLFKTVKPNTSLYGEKDEQGVYLNSYLIPSEWWNQYAGTNTQLSQSAYEYILNNFKAD